MLRETFEAMTKIFMEAGDLPHDTVKRFMEADPAYACKLAGHYADVLEQITNACRELERSDC